MEAGRKPQEKIENPSKDRISIKRDGENNRPNFQWNSEEKLIILGQLIENFFV
jgi:hypothetical protein